MSMKVVPPLALPPGGAFTRASTKTYWDSTGTLRTAAVDQPCFTFDPADLKKAPAGSIELEATNRIRNNTMQGAGPGVAPTNWLSLIQSVNGVTTTVVGTGVESGIEFVDVSVQGLYTGATGTAWSPAFEFGDRVPASSGQVWACSAYFRLVSGSLGSATFSHRIGEGDSSGATLATQTGQGFTPTAEPLRQQRPEASFMMIQPGTAFIQPRLRMAMTTGENYSFILRIGLPQLERDKVTSSIRTSGSAVTRAADIITGTGLIHSTAPEVAPAAYASGTTYGLDQTVSVNGAAGLRSVYRSLQATNLGHTPASSPTWWEYIGDTYQSYAAGTYALGDRVIDPATHTVYESLIPSNTGTLAELGTKWKAIGPTNKTAMIDLKRNTATQAPKLVGAIFRPGQRVDALGLVGMTATSATIAVIVDGVVKYKATEDLNTRTVGSWYEYLYGAFSTKEAIAKFDLPPFTDAVISVALICTGGTPACGGCVMGMSVDIGDVQYEAESDVLNFSTVERDPDTNVAEMTPARNVPKTISNILLKKSQVNRARALRDALNGSPALYAGLDDDSSGYFEALLILGFYRRFTINLKHSQHAIISLELEEI